jgi:hypothetical protein
VYRVTGGRVAGRAFKSPVLLLTTVGCLICKNLPAGSCR